jgi:hypothetical protein
MATILKVSRITASLAARPFHDGVACVAAYLYVHAAYVCSAQQRVPPEHVKHDAAH